MTREGFEQLKRELDRLRTEERRKASQAIADARGHGDISENAEYDAAKEHQAFVEKRISEVEAKLAAAQVIDTSNLTGDRVTFGSTVLLRDANGGGQVRYRIVGSDESDVKQGKISVSSPLARALIGKEPGDEVVVHAPGGQKAYEVLRVNFPWNA
ncbi:MAG: transcription elongation factor GreA [candidate division NC10 bacterium]|nr:transcription elongation factor GreA [candidate division NC10 bacterium]MBI4390449.1 transcription elongation factor GreA [candidate division NC10 bacterium]